MSADANAELRAARGRLPENDPAGKWVDVVLEVDAPAVSAAVAKKLLEEIERERRGPR